jgi:hypothetical protein
MQTAGERASGFRGRDDQRQKQDNLKRMCQGMLRRADICVGPYSV